jgi:hypothetical protein
LTYEIPTIQLIVLTSDFRWRRASTLNITLPFDRVATCTLSVEPGEYSSCPDETGMRRIVFVPASLIPFQGSPSGSRILDLSSVPVVITEPGLYVLDRDWRLGAFLLDGVVQITANNVTLDLQGFRLILGRATGINVSGSQVTVRNGTVFVAEGTAIRTTGASALIEHVRAGAGVDGVIGVSLRGSGSMLINSVATSNAGAAVDAGDDTIVRDNFLSGWRRLWHGHDSRVKPDKRR